MKLIIVVFCLLLLLGCSMANKGQDLTLVSIEKGDDDTIIYTLKGNIMYGSLYIYSNTDLNWKVGELIRLEMTGKQRPASK